MTSTEDAVALEPCPFCGGSNLQHGYAEGGGMMWWFVNCDCGAELTNPSSKAEAIAAWNTRVTKQQHGDDVERVARRLYEHWVEEDFGYEYPPWKWVGDKETWRLRARAALDALHEEQGR